MRFPGVAFIFVLSICTSGCLGRQVESDGCSFRQAVLDIYTAQIIDNLVCAAEDRPFVQVGYRALQVTDQHVLGGTLGGEIDPGSAKTFTGAARVMASSMNTVASKITFGTSFNNNRTMQVFGDPIIGQQDVYTFYLAFAQDPELFVCSDAPPPPCAAHVQKKCGKKWYWVPKEFAGVFLQLALKTTFMRGPEPPPPVLWDTTLASSVRPYKSPEGNRVAKKWIVTLNKAVPNDDGTLYVSIDGLRRSLLIERVLEMPVDTEVPTQPQAAPDLGKPINILYLYAEDDIAKKLVAGQPAQFYAAQFPNQGAKSRDLQRLEEAVDAYQKSHLPSAVCPLVDASQSPMMQSPQSALTTRSRLNQADADIRMVSPCAPVAESRSTYGFGMAPQGNTSRQSSPN